LTWSVAFEAGILVGEDVTITLDVRFTDAEACV
jgi:hypothetical protein